ncbi:MAG: hypothetical protein JEY94_04540 [Melioribacteraceae bacterium]|nr:hypothetical protein [Melioribacteraceae bacterium]
MLSENKFLIEEFENEIWLYLDKNLDDERMLYWKDKIENNDEIKTIYDEINSTLNSYSQLETETISEIKFSSMIQKTIEIDNKSIINRFVQWLKGINIVGLNFPKLALSGSLALVAFLIILFSNKPSPLKEISADLLDWDAPQLTSKMEKTTYDFAYIKNKELENYLLERIQNDPWKRSYHNIKSSMSRIEKEIKQESL